MQIIDTHTHLNDIAFVEDINEVINRCKENNIKAVFNNGDSLESFSRILQLEQLYPNYCFSVLGIHPEFSNKNEEYYKDAFSIIYQYKDHIKAIGEIGLDYHYDKSEDTKRKQKELFIKQINLAKELNLPIVIHSRDADFDTLNIIKETLPKKIDLHCYSSSYEILKEYLRLPIEVHIGIGGVCTFKNAKTIQTIIKEMPLNIMLTETDAPYLAPTPFRGQRNEPSYLTYVIKQIAQLRSENEESISEILYNNGREFYGI